MSKQRKTHHSAAMLELWRPPHDAGEPIGCLASTYTFAPELFDEQCLARFLKIESEPNREDLAFLLERESRLGSIYAGGSGGLYGSRSRAFAALVCASGPDSEG